MILDTKYIDLFPVKISRVVLDLDHEAITNYTLDHREKHSWKDYTTFHDTKLNRNWMSGLPDKDKLDEAINTAAIELCRQTDRKELTNPFTWYWVSIYDVFDAHGTHNHPGALISGTYWPSADGDSSPLFVEAPYDNHTMHDRLPKEALSYQYPPKTGDMLVWPSWLKHRVVMQKEHKTPRIAISFNVDYDWATLRAKND
tara:strand:- start:87 stop:686 length:600 start_codon:yes stop_codon:yes gene_type:complete